MAQMNKLYQALATWDLLNYKVPQKMLNEFYHVVIYKECYST